MKCFLASVVVGLVLFSGLISAWQVDFNEDQKLAQWFDRFLEEEFQRRPLDATRLGDHRWDHLLEVPSKENQADWNKQSKVSRETLNKAIDPSKLSKSGLVDFKIIQEYFDRNEWLYANSKPYVEDPRIYSEYISDALFLPLTQSTISEKVIVEKLAERVKKVPSVLAAAMKNIHQPHEPHLKTAISQNKGSIRFYKSGIGDFVKNADSKKFLLDETNKVIPNLEAYQDFLEKVKPNPEKESWRVGKKKFCEKLVSELMTDISADELYSSALADIELVTNEMYVIARQLWSKLFPATPFPADTVANRAMVIRRVLEKLADNSGKPDELLSDTKKGVEQIRKFIEKANILDLPKPDRCQIVEMPEFQRGNSVAYLNNAPPLDSKASSIYAISPPPSNWDEQTSLSFMREYNRYMLQILTIHEAYPGHYVQLEYSNRHPSKIRRVLSSGVFAEGWAVYCEKMMLDEGYGEQDLALRLHQLKWYLRAIANSVLDHEMHCKNMTDEQAMTLLVEKAFQTKGEALGKIIRAKQSSCQLSTYYAGALFFKKLRTQIQDKMGNQFKLNEYHHAVLNHGTMPLKFLSALVFDQLNLSN
ncbi:MAG: DUF885 domain-containing protein [Gemmataceae bacterium]